MMEILGRNLQMTDLLRTKYGMTPATFGRVDEEGNALERVLTKEDETKFEEGLDYIIVGGSEEVRIEWDEVRVEPFYTPRQQFTQISDHAGVQAAFWFP
jgi:hypothetical protein